MVRIDFSSKHWGMISDYLFSKYRKYRFLYLNQPDLKSEKSYLLFRYIDDRSKFNEMIRILINNGVDISIKEDS